MGGRQRTNIQQQKGPHIPLVPDPCREGTSGKDHQICLPTTALYSALYIYSHQSQLYLYARNSVLLNVTKAAKWSH